MASPFRIVLVASAWLAVTRAAAAEEEFVVRLGIRHGHIREVFFGCAKGATPGYDADLDDLAPPRGIETGYTVFLPADRKLPPFYKDVRPPTATVTWTFFAEVYEGKPVRIDWSPAGLPPGWKFTIGKPDTETDMASVDHMDIPATRTLQITAARLPDGEVKEEKK